MFRFYRCLKFAAIAVLSFFCTTLHAQTDTEFWFVVPEITISHQFPGGQPASFRISTGLLPATVTISMPANQYDPVTNPAGFPDIVFNMPANSFHIEDLTCWIMSPCSPPTGASTDINKLENKPINASGINNFGILITATNPITAYWEVSRTNNKDIWALKGHNALGTDFYTPFQTHMYNQSITPVQPYSAIDVVATEDFTTVTFDLPAGIAASYGQPMTNVPAGGILNVNLMRGETFSLFPINKSRAAADRLRGTHVTSNNPIAITLKDDSFLHTSGGCYDVAGDQLVPTSIAGKEYAVIRTFLNNHDHIYILGTVDGTIVTVYNTGGAIVAPSPTTINAGQQLYYQLPAGQTYYRIVADQPVYVWHVGGFGCEQGGAILPPIDICTGSTQVAFARTSTENFYINLMVRQGAETGFLFDGVVRNDLFLPASFTPIPSSDWSVARFGPFTTAQIPVGSHFMENTMDIFHLGIVNGGAGSGCFYGYFSDYNKLNVQAVVAGTSYSQLRLCYGDSAQLFAWGGTDYLWWPDSTLSDPTSQMPMASPHVTTKYYVEVSGACDMKDTATIDVLVSTPLGATFTTDRVEGCAPFTVTFTDHSFGISSWRYDFGDGSPYARYDYDISTPYPEPPSPFVFTHTFTNTTDSIITYKVVLLARNADGCSVVYEKYITVYPSISASFTPITAEGCEPQTVTFTNGSSSNTADIYLWEYGDGFNEISTNPTGLLTHIFSNTTPHDTIYQMRMIATSPFACRDTATAAITIYSHFTADFAIDVSSGCSPVTVHVDNQSVGDTARYVWTLNGTPFKTTGLDTTLILTNNTNTFMDYSIQLQVFNAGNRCSKSVTRTVRVYPEVNAAFTIPGGNSYCNLSSVAFSNSTTPTSTNPGGVVNVYSWNFGDGGSSALVNPTHVYDNQTNISHVYTVTLTARNQFGCQDVATANITIYSQLYADFGLTPTAQCSPVTASIDNNSRGGIVTYLWSYGDATTSGTTTDHTHPYTNTGLTPVTRTITLTVTNEGGCTDVETHDITIYPSVTAGFTPSVSAGCNELAVNFDNTSKSNATIYSWNFGDGGSSVEFEPSHTFTNLTGVDVSYPVTLTVLTEYGCTASTSTNITVYPYIDAQFGLDASFGCSPLDVQFVYDKHPGITQYRWDWDGNGTVDQTTLPAAPNTINHVYVNQTGAVQNLTPRLTVTNSHSCTDTKTTNLSVYPEVTARFTPSVTAGCNQLSVNLSNTSYFTGVGTPLSGSNYYWVFGDGGSSILPSPTHLYINDDPNNNAIYTTRLLAVSQYGCSDEETRDIEVYNRVESHFTFEHASSCTPFEVTFHPAAIGASTYIWTYGGAPGLPASETFANGNPFSRTFTNTDPNNTATYTVTLEARNNENCPSLESYDIEVYPIVAAGFTPSTLAGCSDLEVNLTSTSTGGSLSYLWDLGNGQSATTTNVTHTFTNRGSIDSVYTVQLLTINPLGCRDSIEQSITVHPKVEAEFVFAQQSQCTPFYIDLTNTSLNGNTFNWHTHYNGDTLTINKNPFAYQFDNLTLNDILTDSIVLVSSDNVTGCTDTTFRLLQIYPRVVSQFNVDRLAGCNPLTVNFSNSSSGLSTYLWEFGDGATSVDNNPAPHVYEHPYKDQSKLFTVGLSATNAFGCKDFKDTVITVYPLVKADFQWNRFEGCTPLTINLNNSSTSPLYLYRWNFDDGSPFTFAEQPLTHTYTNATTTPPDILHPTITLRTSYVNDTTCIDSLKLPVNVFPHIYPEFSYDSTGCHPLDVTFTNQTVAYGGVGNASYLWDLGTGVSSFDQNTTFGYTNTSQTDDSTFTIRLRATSIHGCEDSITHQVVVHPRPYAAMELVGEYVSCPPFNVEIDNNSIGTNLTYIYDFGDGNDSTTTSGANMHHIFHNLSSETRPYQIDLRAVTEYGCDNSVSQTIYVFPEVVASYVANPGYQACSPFDVQFQNSSLNAKFYRWDFADGITSSYHEPAHSFLNFDENDKQFDVVLYASSEYSCFDTDTQHIIVYATPIANIAVEPPLQVFPNATFNIYNQSSPAANSWSYSWSFDDNQYSSDKNPGTHTYLKWGPKENGFKYNVIMHVASPHCQDADTSVVYLFPAEPVANFSGDIDSSCSPLTVHFINTSQWADSYLWDFGDSTTSAEREPIHTYTQPGYYTARLTASGDGGQHFYYRIFRVYENPKADFAVYPQRVMLPDATIHAYNLSTNFSRSFWDLGDGYQTWERDPMHTYTNLGEFKISLWTYMDYGDDVCIDSISKFPAVWVEGVGYVNFPNAFKPNPAGPNGGLYDAIDYKNEVFHPYHFGVVEYKLMIFSRWGEQLFTSNDVNIGWDGYVNGKLAEQGVYMWRAIGKFTNGKTFDKKGSVTLLR